MDSIFKYGHEVWFTYEFNGKSYESHGMIDEVYYFNDVRKHKYKIIADASGKPFYIWEDKISFFKKEDQDRLRCVDCKYSDISIGRCASCNCSHRLFVPKESCDIKELEEAYSKAEAMCDNSEPRKVCKTCKNRECGLAYEPCLICKGHNMWESTKVNPFLLGDLVMYKDASKPEVFTVIEIIEFHSTPGEAISYSYRIKRTARDGMDIVHLVDHDRLEKVEKQYRGGYIYPVGARVRFKFGKKELIGYIQERYQDSIYEIRDDEKTYVIIQDHILGYSAKNWIDDPSIRKAFGLDVKNDIYENIKKQINKDQLNFHYGLSSIFKLAPNDAAVPFELSEKEKKYVRNDAADSLSYSLKRKLDRIHSNAVYGLNTDLTSFSYLTVFDEFVNIKEDNKMKKEQKKRNRNIIKCNGKYERTIKDITFNGPAVIVKFEPTMDDYAYGSTKGDKVVVVCKDGDKYDMKTGFLLAILKEFLNNQSYGNILEKLDSFDALDIPQVGKEIDKTVEKETAKIVFCKFQVGDIVRFEHGVARFKVDKRTTFTTKSGKVVPRYRLLRVLGAKYAYSTYANENELVLADEVYQK